MAKSAAVKLVPNEETALIISLLPDGSMKIEKVRLKNDMVQSRETFAHDMAEIVLNQLDRHILHARRTGGQI